MLACLKRYSRLDKCGMVNSMIMKCCGVPQYTQWEWPLARQCSVRAVSLNWHWQCEPDPYTEKSTGCQWHWLVGTCPKLALPGVFWSQSGASPSGQCTLALMEQQALDVERIRQYPGRVQVERRVKLKVPGKHFPALTPAEQKESYARGGGSQRRVGLLWRWQVHRRGQQRRPRAAAPHGEAALQLEVRVRPPDRR